MNIGIVTTWMERGAAYVSKNYMKLFEAAGHNVYIYARGGEECDKKGEWNTHNVFWGERNKNTVMGKKKFFSWIKKNKLDMVLFNEQKYFPIVVYAKRKFTNVKFAAYIDYYKEDTIKFYNIYDFVICNTERHLQAFRDHEQAFYLKWGVDTKLYCPKNEYHNELTFFHSVGMSNRKGTRVLVDAFIQGEIYKKSKLIIHTQIPIENVCNYNSDELKKYNVEVIQKTVTAPGLYHKGDVYVYPTTLDGLGLTLYEALSCGLPVITTDCAPMNEPINNEVGRLVRVEEYHSRADGYYWPLSIVSKNDLIKQMMFFIDNREQLDEYKIKCHNYAQKNYELLDRVNILEEIVTKASIRPVDDKLAEIILASYKKEKKLLISKLADHDMFLVKVKEIIYRIKG